MLSRNNRNADRMRRHIKTELACILARDVMSVIDAAMRGADGTTAVYVDPFREIPEGVHPASVAVVATGPAGEAAAWFTIGEPVQVIGDAVIALIHRVRGPEPPPRHAPADVIPFTGPVVAPIRA